MTESAKYQIQAYGYSDVGRVRSSNEDSFFVADLSEGLLLKRNGVLNFASGPLGSLFAVADGMGGAAGGETASRVGIQTLYTEVQDLVREAGPTDDGSLEQILIEAVGTANHRIYEMSSRTYELEGMGTTLTIALELHGRLLVGQVGDSRAYLLRNGAIRQLTRDQSLVAQKVSAGQLTEEQARRHPQRNVLLQALGVRSRVELGLSRLTVQPRDILLLCSDGLHSQMGADEMHDLVLEAAALKDACLRLVEVANKRGGPDNVTAVLIRFVDSGDYDDETVEDDDTGLFD